MEEKGREETVSQNGREMGGELTIRDKRAAGTSRAGSFEYSSKSEQNRFDLKTRFFEGISYLPLLLINFDIC